MRIIHISGSMIPSRTANSIQTMKMCQAFASLGHEVTLLCRKNPKNHLLYEEVFKFYNVEKCFEINAFPCPSHNKIRGGWGIIFGWQCHKFISKNSNNIDLIFGRCDYGILPATWADIPYIYEAHVLPSNWLHYAIEHKLFRAQSFLGLVVLSEVLRHEYKRLFPELQGSYITVAHSGVDITQHNKSPKPIIPWPGREATLQVGYVGHLYPRKGIGIVIELASRMPNIDFHIVGGTDEDIQHWRNRCHNNNVYFHGFVPPSETPRYRAMCDILLMPYQEGANTNTNRNNVIGMSPLKMFEYMASRRPIIASRLPVFEEVLHNGDNAILVNPQDLTEWEIALRRLAEDPTLRTRLAEKAYRDVVANYTWERRAEKIIKGLVLKSNKM